MLGRPGPLFMRAGPSLSCFVHAMYFEELLIVLLFMLLGMLAPFAHLELLKSSLPLCVHVLGRQQRHTASMLLPSMMNGALSSYVLDGWISKRTV